MADEPVDVWTPTMFHVILTIEGVGTEMIATGEDNYGRPKKAPIDKTKILLRMELNTGDPDVTKLLKPAVDAALKEW